MNATKTRHLQTTELYIVPEELIKEIFLACDLNAETVSEDDTDTIIAL